MIRLVSVRWGQVAAQAAGRGVQLSAPFCYGGSEVSRDSDGMNDDDQEFLQQRLAELKSEHRDLDDVIDRLSEKRPVDQLQIQRLKKRKLRLKDDITKIESRLLPDIIA
jgi:hypothetical protein